MKAIFRLAVFFVIALLATPVAADYFVGSELDRMSTDEPHMFHGYVAGVLDMRPEGMACIPEEVRVSQSVAIVKKYLADHPNQWHRAGKILVVAALVEAFPCK